MPSPSGEFADEVPAEQSSAAAAPQHPPALGGESHRPGIARDELQYVDSGVHVRELIECATALLGTRPVAAERMLLQALGTGVDVLSGEQRARLRSLVVTAIAQQPGREDDLAAAALAAAGGWADISVGDAAHHTVIAARIHYRGGHYRSAAALFARALSRGELPYPQEEIAVLYEQLGRCLDEGRRYRAAARAYTAGAAVIAGRTQWAELHADLTDAADRSRQSARHPGAILRAWVRSSQPDGGTPEHR